MVKKISLIGLFILIFVSVYSEGANITPLYLLRSEIMIGDFFKHLPPHKDMSMTVVAKENTFRKTFFAFSGDYSYAVVDNENNDTFIEISNEQKKTKVHYNLGMDIQVVYEYLTEKKEKPSAIKIYTNDILTSFLTYSYINGTNVIINCDSSDTDFVLAIKDGKYYLNDDEIEYDSVFAEQYIRHVFTYKNLFMEIVVISNENRFWFKVIKKIDGAITEASLVGNVNDGYAQIIDLASEMGLQKFYF